MSFAIPRSFRTFVLAALVVACSDEAPPAEPTETSSTSPSSPAPTPNTAAPPEAAPSNTARLPPAPAEAHSATRATFAVVGNRVIPLACYDGESERLLQGTECFGLIPDGSSIRLMNSRDGCCDESRVVGIHARTDVECIDDARSAYAFEPAVEAGAHFDYAVFPESLQSYRITRSDSPVDRTALRAAFGHDEIAGYTHISGAQVHGAGTVWDFAAVAFGRGPRPPERDWPPAGADDPASEEPAPPFVASGLLRVSSQDTPNVLLRSEWELFQVIGAVDLDSDERPEILVTSEYYEGLGVSVHSLQDFAVIGQWGCGA